jgi:hypothetical protein
MGTLMIDYKMVRGDQRTRGKKSEKSFDACGGNLSWVMYPGYPSHQLVSYLNSA